MRRLRVILGSGVLIMAGATPSMCQEIDEKLAAAVKGAYMCSIAQYATWPSDSFPDADSPVVIQILGEDPHGVRAVLDQAITKKRIMVDGRPIKIRSAASPDVLSPQAMETCHILFLTRSGKSRWGEVKPALRERAVLTISEVKGFADTGGMIEFAPAKQSGSSAVKIIMRVHLGVVLEADLKLKSEFLKLVEIVGR